MTYARARLWIGISYVGTIVVLSLSALLLGLPAVLFPTQAVSMAMSLLHVAGFVGACLLLGFPFDLMGGYILPLRYGRAQLSLSQFLIKWGRGAVIHSSILILVGTSLIQLASVWGNFGAVGGVAVIVILLITFQKRFAQWIGGFSIFKSSTDEEIESSSSQDLQWASNQDHGFAGGVTGWPGMEVLILPSTWNNELTSEQRDAELTRRRIAVRSGSRALGLTLAALWTIAGLAVAMWSTGAGFDTVAGLITLSLAFTLWSFFGLLLLPTPSRWSVFAVDREALHSGVSERELLDTAAALDRLQDDEPSRSRMVESVFHPVPSVTQRERALRDSSTGPFSSWHVARLSLYLSWAGMGLLSRAVHCNAGRPELWVLLPCD